MTVRELIAKLQTTCLDARVVVDGYEGGVDDCTSVEEVLVVLDQHTAGYFGRHSIAEEWIEGERVQAVHVR